MNLILLSGGSGKRLWPLSNDSRSKQFLKLLEDGYGNKESMVERVWKQIKLNKLDDNAVVATNASQLEILHNQLGNELNYVVEPTRMDTFAAIALSTLYMHDVKGINCEEIITVLPVDPYVEDSFFGKIKELEYFLNNSKYNVGLIGVKPTFPSTKYGYIIPSSNKSDKVHKFVEKPNEEKASEMIKENSLWNCGVFAFRISYLINYLEENGYPSNYVEFLKKYDSLPTKSFDYEVLESEKNIGYITYEGFWKDLGTWNTLTEEMAGQTIGNVISSKGTNTHIINETNIPIISIGVSDLIIAASHDGILISKKTDSPKIKDIINEFNNVPMYEEKVWGQRTILDIQESSNFQIITSKIVVEKQDYVIENLSEKCKYTLTIIKGHGTIVTNNDVLGLSVGDSITIDNKSFNLTPIGKVEFIEIRKNFRDIKVNI